MFRKPALLYAVFITTFPGGSLLYSKMYRVFKDNYDAASQTQQPHPMTLAALFYAIQTYANELCTESVKRLQRFCHDGKMVCFKIVDSILVITVTSSKLNGSIAMKHCELVANKFLAKLKEQPETLTSGQKIKGFSRELKKCNMVLMKSLIRLSTLKEIKSIASDDKQVISALYKFKIDATAETNAAVAIGDAKLNIETSLPGDKKILLNYLERYNSDILDGSSTWYSVKAGPFVGCACGDLLLARRDPSRESSTKEPVFDPPFPVDLILEDIDLM
eukprot:g62.t1